MNNKLHSTNGLKNKLNSLNSSVFLLLIAQSILESLELRLFDKLHLIIDAKNLRMHCIIAQ